MSIASSTKKLSAVVVTVLMLLVPLALRAPAQAVSATSLSDYCKHNIGYSPYCNTIAGVPVTAKGMKPGTHTYCYTVWNSKAKAIRAAAQVIGHKAGKLHTVRSGNYGKLCAPLPKGKCPRVNLFWLNGDANSNLGTFPSCKGTTHLPTQKHPTYKRCLTNHGTTRLWVDLYRGNTLSEENLAKPDKTVCVSQSFKGQKNVQQHLSVLTYTGGGGSFSTSMVDTVAVIHRW